MKTLKLIGACLAVLGVSVCGISCSSDDDDPFVEPEEEVILTPIPDGAEPGKVYAISHNKKDDKCVFQFYFGDYSTEEMRERFSLCTVSLKVLDATGNELYSGLLDSPDITSSRGNTFEVPCLLCERIRRVEYSFLYNYDTEWDRIRKYGSENHTQEYRSPHSFNY